jgi:hypothetical protein
MIRTVHVVYRNGNNREIAILMRPRSCLSPRQHSNPENERCVKEGNTLVLK